MVLEEYINLLLNIEAQITENYLALYTGEVLNKTDSLEYEECFKNIIELTKKETKIISHLTEQFSLNTLKEEILKRKYSPKEIPLTLGHLVDAEIYRLFHLFEHLTGDDVYDYANTLKTDINHLMLNFLNELINNPYYASIRNELILYRYNLIYMDPYLENDFLYDMLSTNISLEADKYRTEELPSHIFVDKSILVLESLDFIEYIRSHDDLNNSSNTYALIVISVINILSRLVLCDEETLNLIYDDLVALLDAEEISIETKNLITSLQTILKNMHFGWSR